MPRTANKSGASTPRVNPAIDQAMLNDEQIGGRKSRNPNDAVLDALNADRAAPDHSASAKGEVSGRQTDSVERNPPEKTRSRPTH
ncbi:hypothetical protein [Solimonas sp. SE-A11]|uniref:hypothetical protein n=1 Tax=Solimonas sp. SE-A11 TaxID=3054954 RepID=UPI00259D0A99|nr:hypothetical protein [Solimonas sp. SE-A11]MDM4771247.1 hypothetical protein [Solimonas sp. SE-A11]